MGPSYLQIRGDSRIDILLRRMALVVYTGSSQFASQIVPLLSTSSRCGGIGRRSRLKICSEQSLVGSSPTICILFNGSETLIFNDSGLL